jgi:hypothetical protein
MANNGLNGFAASAGATNASADVTLARNAISRNGGDGIQIYGASGARLEAALSANALNLNAGHAIHATGPGAHVWASGNAAKSNRVSGSTGLACDASAQLDSRGDNNADSTSNPGGCLTVVPLY